MFVSTWLLAILSAMSVYTALALLARLLKALGVMLPVPDHGFRIFACASPRAMDLVAFILGEQGLKPGWRLPSKNVQRVVMKDRLTILNASTDALRQSMKAPAAALAIPVADPKLSAKIAVAQLSGSGYAASMAELPEVEGKPMWYVSSDAFPGWVLLFRLSLLKMGKPKLSRWRG